MSTSLSEKDKKILNISLENITENDDLFRRYALAFYRRDINDMIKVQQAWQLRYPKTRFRQEYAEYLKLSS